jgi:hypothetical protein
MAEQQRQLTMTRESMEAFRAAIKQYTRSDQTKDDLREALRPILGAYAADIEKNGDSLDDVLDIVIKQAPRKPPYRVHVQNGDQSVDLGEGTYTHNATVYVYRTPTGELRSNHDATQLPPGIPLDDVDKIPDNPVIQLDSGDVVYGCQVWWGPVEDNE